MNTSFKDLKISVKKANVHVTDKSQRDCVCRLYMSYDPVTSIPIFNLISVDSEDTKDPEVLKNLGRLIDESPVIKGEYICIYTTMEPSISKSSEMPSIASFDEDFLTSRYVKNPSFMKGGRQIYTQLGSPLSFRFVDNRFILETGEEFSILDAQKNLVFCDSEGKNVVFINQTLPKIAEGFMDSPKHVRNDGINLLKDIRKNFSKNLFIEPELQMEITLLDAILENEDLNEVEILNFNGENEVDISDDIWGDISNSVNGILNLPGGLNYEQLPKLSMAKDMMIQGLGENIWNLSKSIFQTITPVSLDDIRTIAAPNSYESPFDTYLMQLDAVGIPKKISDITYENIRKIYSPDDVKLYELGDMDILYVKDQYQESFYFFPGIEYLNSDYKLNSSGFKF